MVVTIHQPEHLPWLGFFHKMSRADVFVILDSVQYRKNYFQNRNRIIGTNEPQWLCVPVDMKGHMSMNLSEMRIANETQYRWREKYLKTIEYSYSRHPYFKEFYPFFDDLLHREQEKLCELNLEIIRYFAGLLMLHPEFIRSSELNIQGTKSDLILNICRAVGAKSYISGPSGRDYLKMDEFKNNGIEITYDDFIHPVYEQRKAKEFVPYLSVLDLLMNMGTEGARRIILERQA